MGMNGIDFCEVVTLVNDPEPRVGNAGGVWCTFRAAYNPRVKGQDGKFVDGETTWLGVKAFNQFAEQIAATFGKGDRALVKGRLVTRRYVDNNGAEREGLELTVDEIGACPRFAQVQIARHQRAGGGFGGGSPQGQSDWTQPPANVPQNGGSDFGAGFDDEKPF